jgi:hypothetical protein
MDFFENGGMVMNIEITEHDKIINLTVEQLLMMNPLRVNINERVPGVEGKAMDFLSLYDLWAKAYHPQSLEPPTHLNVEAADEFSALIPWQELQCAALLYEQEGLPLKKGYPLRLYVPDGSSACLNVKSIVKLHFMHQSEEGTKATFGFKNKISADDLRKK